MDLMAQLSGFHYVPIGRGVVALLAISDPGAIPCLCVLRVDLRGFLKGGDGLVEFALLAVEITEVEEVQSQKLPVS